MSTQDAHPRIITQIRSVTHLTFKLTIKTIKHHNVHSCMLHSILCNLWMSVSNLMMEVE